MADEYYIRTGESDEARGPFTVEKLVSLVDASQVDKETLFYDEEKETWMAIRENPELAAEVFPERAKLGLRKKVSGDFALLNPAEDEETEGVNVESMLAAAEGDTEDTRYLKDEAKRRDKAAGMSIPTLGVIMIISAATFLVPSFQLIQQVLESEEYMLLMQQPLVIVGVIDLLLAIILFLAVSEIFPMVRFRAMIGLGFFGFTAYAQYMNTGDPNALYTAGTVLAASLGVFICSLTLNLYLMITSAVVGILGTIGYFYFTVITKMLASGSGAEGGAE